METFAIALLISCVVALLICLGLKSQMNTARKRSAATEYVLQDGIEIHTRIDRFIRKTRTSREIKK